MVLKPQQQNEPRLVPKWLEELGCERAPYLKNIPFNMLKPQQFGLDEWQRYFVIPDKWMQRIYKDEVYYDTDLPKREEPASLTNEQKKLIYDWLTNESPFRYRAQKKPSPIRSKRKLEPSSDLVDVLEAAKDSDLDSEDLLSDHSDDSDIHNPQTIALMIAHKYQPEHMIVRKAIQNMRRLPKEEQNRVNELMSYPEVMKFIHEKVSAHLGKSSDGYAV